MSLAADRYALAMSGGMLMAGSTLVPAVLANAVLANAVLANAVLANAVLAKLSEAGMKPAICHQVREPVMGALAMAAFLGKKPDSKSV